MSLEITSAAVATPSAAPARGAGRPGQANGVPSTNPFGALLAGLDAVRRPEVSDISETHVPTSTTTTDPNLLPTEATVATPGAADAARIFISPAFNSRLALAQTAETAKLTPAEPIVENEPPLPPVGTDTSLLALLTAKAKAVVALASAASATPVATSEAETAESANPVVAVELAPCATDLSHELTNDAEDSGSDAPQDAPVMDTAVAVADAVLPAPVILPVAPISLPQADTQSPDVDTDLAAANSAGQTEARISLFDKLAHGAKAATEAPTDVPADTAPVELAASDALEPVVATEAPKPALHHVSTAQAAAPDVPPAQNNVPPPTMPTVTMRPLSAAQMVEGVSVLMTRASKNQVNEFVIRMDPPELGRIDVQMKMHEDGTVQAIIASDNVNTHDLLRREASTIERALADSGFRTGSDGLSFNLKQQGGNQQRPDFSGSGAAMANGAASSPDDAIPATVFAPLRQRYENARVNITA